MPAQVIAAASQAGREVFVLAFEGETDPALVQNLPHAWVPLGAIGQALRTLHTAGAEDVVMIGPVRRPALSQLKLDLRGMQLLAKLGLQGHGDDRIFKAIVGELEGEGFHVVGADDFLDTLLAGTGAMTAKAPAGALARTFRRGVARQRLVNQLRLRVCPHIHWS